MQRELIFKVRSVNTKTAHESLHLGELTWSDFIHLENHNDIIAVSEGVWAHCLQAENKRVLLVRNCCRTIKSSAFAQWR